MKCRFFTTCYFIVFISFYSCTNENVGFSHTDNAQLEKVISYYKKSGDSLKLKAAEFLINNMEGHYSETGDDVVLRTKIFSCIDSIQLFKGELSNKEKIKIADSVFSTLKLQGKTVSNIPDEEIITSEFLISNIQLAFKAWQTTPWGEKIGFNDFCEYILPYRVRNERLEDFRGKFFNDYTFEGMRAYDPDSLNLVFDRLNSNLEIPTNFDTSLYPYFPYTQSLKDIIQGGVGGCETLSLLGVSALRSAGLPVALDFLPHWGSSAGQHYLTYIKRNKNNIKRITNANVPVNTWSIVDFSSEYRSNRHTFLENEMPRGQYVQYVKTIPKIFRLTYSSNKQLSEINKSFDKDHIDPIFRTTKIRDVTSEYIEGIDMQIQLDKKFDKRLIHLCVFDIDGWHAVDYAIASGNHANFKNIGKNIIYLPTVFEDGIHIPIESPFLLTNEGQQQKLKLNGTKWHELKMERKTALFSYTAYHTEGMLGARIEGANNQDFSDAELLYTIDFYPFYMNERTINNSKKFRYVRYVAPANNPLDNDNIAELSFFGGGAENKLSGQLIGTPGKQGNDISKAFDNNILTYYEPKSGKNSWIGLDLGSGKETTISKVAFCPRNDANCVLPGEKYELLYWDGKWISLGQRKAQTYSITFKDVPKGTIYWLRCITSGKEERIFLIENNIQKWY